MIKLNSGRIITLSTLHQSHTYEGLLEGIPRKQMNDEYIERFRRQAEKELTVIPPVVIEPVRRAVPAEVPGDCEAFTQAFGPREQLPAIACHARFSSSPVRNERQDESLLVILWFQDSWAPPIDPAVIEEIKKVDWETKAMNYTN